MKPNLNSHSIDDSKHLLELNRAADLILRHKVNSLQVIPAVAIKLIRLTGDENSKVTDLSLLIETEPTLAARVLRNVNSAAFALSHKITSIKRAVNILGFSSVRQLALNQLFYNKLINHRTKNQFNQLFFWQHCLFVASLSRTIAIALKHPDPDLIYSAGLMHDIGKIVLETHGKVSYSDFIVSSKHDDQSTLKAEQDFFGINHAEIGFVFCQQWDIPEQISAIVYRHHDLPSSNSIYTNYKLDIAIVNFANYIAWMQGIGSIESNKLSDLHPDVSKHLDIEKLDLETLLSLVDKEMQLTREFYGIKFPSLNKLRASLVETSLLINNYTQPTNSTNHSGKNNYETSLTTPHRSLNSNEIIPWTLEAIHNDFNFERLIMLNINPQQRSLFTQYTWPESLSNQSITVFNFKIDLFPRAILSSLRDRKPIIINAEDESNNPILRQFQVEEFLIVPILSNNQLVALLYADNVIKQTPIEPQTADQLKPIIHELGVALANAKRFELEKKRAEFDSLTGLFNKRMIIDFLADLFQLKQNKHSQIAVGFIDIDHFKKFNDSCGHQAGDDVLKIVAQIMRTHTRPRDFIGRYGGEEFIFVIQETDLQGAHIYAERIRQEIERKGKILSHRFLGHELTVSIGVCMHKPSYSNYSSMIEAADTAMYSAKRNGRNCVISM